MKGIEQRIEKINKNCVNKNIILTRSIFLRSLALVYLMAFLSLYFQIQGLWGEEGLLPARILIEKFEENYKEKANFFNFPTLLWFHETINTYFLKFLTLLLLPFQNYNIAYYFTTQSSVDNTMHLLCILGIIFSIGIVLNFSYAYNPLGYFIMWIVYLNFFIVGQVFTSYQWDVFLLEIGFLAIFLAPWTKSSLDIITAQDELVFYLLRFLMFRFIYSNGIVKVTANCPAWMSFTALHHHFQSQPLPNMISYHMHFYLPDGVKKMLTAFTYVAEIYIPFLFFVFIRRFTIFAGVLQNILQIGIIFTGNFNFFNLLTIVLNLSNFDDKFLRSCIPQAILNFFELDPLYKIYRYILQKENMSGQEKDKLKISEEDESTTAEDVGGDNDCFSQKQSKKILDILKDKELRNIPDLDEYDQNNPKNYFDRESMLHEFILFFNLFVISLLITFYYIYPLKELLPGNLKITTKNIEFVYNQNFLNYYMLFIFFYISFKYALHIIYGIKNSILEFLTFSIISTKISKSSPNILYKLASTFLFFFNFTKNFIFFLFFILYFLNATNVFYSSIDLQLTDKNSQNGLENFLHRGVNITDYLFTRFRINHGYGLFRQMTGINGRPELELKIFNDRENKWENLNFPYKMSDEENFKLKWNIPHQPRMDWQIWFSALSNNINSEPWLVIMSGKILERNPVILSMLGYYVDEAEIYYKYSIFDRLTTYMVHGREKLRLDFIPSKIKIDSYLYTFSTKKSDLEKRKFWNKKFVKDFIPAIDKRALKGIFQMYGLPEIDPGRKVQISPFQLIPIVDLIFLLMMSKYLFKFLNLNLNL